MRKNRLKACTAIGIKAKNNHLNPNKVIFKNNTLNNIIKADILMKDLYISNNKCL